MELELELDPRETSHEMQKLRELKSLRKKYIAKQVTTNARIAQINQIINTLSLPARAKLRLRLLGLNRELANIARQLQDIAIQIAELDKILYKRPDLLCPIKRNKPGHELIPDQHILDFEDFEIPF